jgi:alanine racemase
VAARCVRTNYGCAILPDMIYLQDLRNATGAQIYGQAAADTFDDFCYDARQAQPGQLYVAVSINGSDGHEHIGQAIEGGASGVLCETPPQGDVSGLTVLVVEDVTSALAQWAEHVLRKSGATVVAIGGELGKSVTQQAIVAVLSTRYNVYNNSHDLRGRLGLALGLGRLTTGHQVVIIELARDHFGEMRSLLAMTRPYVGVVTNLGNIPSHGPLSLEHGLEECQELVAALPADGTAILNYDDKPVRHLDGQADCQALTFGQDISGQGFGADLLGYNIRFSEDSTAFDVRYAASRFQGNTTTLLGQPGLYAALAALSVGMVFEVPLSEGLRALNRLVPLPGHLNPLPGIGGTWVIDDSFSATPDSVCAALDWLAMVPVRGRRVFVMGDFGQPDDIAYEVQREIGRRAAEVADLFVTCGQQAAIAGCAAREAGYTPDQVQLVYNFNDAAACVEDVVGPGDVVLVQGHPQARMERVVECLLAYPEDAARLPRRQVYTLQLHPPRPARLTWIELDLEAVAHNVRQVKARVGEDVSVMAIVKANAYGHGAVQVATTALNNGADYLGVASLDEAMQLRQAGVTEPILILGHTPAWGARQAVQNDLAVTIYDLETARAFDRAARELRWTVKAHIKVDLGMGRLGLLPDQVAHLVRKLNHLEAVEIEGIYTHLLLADDLARTAQTREQLRQFTAVLRSLDAAGMSLRYVHAANSAAILSLPSSHFNMVRLGLAMYGLHPSVDVPCPPDFQRVLTWKATVVQVKSLSPGDGNNADQPRRIAIIPVGHADGFRRAPRDWGEVLIRGERAPLSGPVAMNLAMVDVTHIPGARAGDEVVLIGRQGRHEITAEDVARRLDTVNYEIVASIPAHIPRIT